MGNTLPENASAGLPDLLIRASRERPDCGHADQLPQIFAPWLDNLAVAQRDLLSILPVLDVNGTLFAALDSETGQAAPEDTRADRHIAALLCVDPFLRLRDATRLLKSAGIRAVTNFPTVQLVDGTAARGFESADLGLEREAEILHQFLRQGFAVTGFATSTENAQRLLALGIRDLVIHPGPASSDWRNRATAAQKAAETTSTLRTHAPATLRLFCPDAYGRELDSARNAADGLVRYG